MLTAVVCKKLPRGLPIILHAWKRLRHTPIGIPILIVTSLTLLLRYIRVVVDPSSRKFIGNYMRSIRPWPSGLSINLLYTPRVVVYVIGTAPGPTRIIGDEQNHSITPYVRQVLDSRPIDYFQNLKTSQTFVRDKIGTSIAIPSSRAKLILSGATYHK